MKTYRLQNLKPGRVITIYRNHKEKPFLIEGVRTLGAWVWVDGIVNPNTPQARRDMEVFT